MKIIRLAIHGLEICLITLGVMFLLLKAEGMNIYVVLSGSMNPTVETGSVVLVDTEYEDYVIGDIVTYKIDDQLVTHRIVEMEEDICRTKGDANEVPDSGVIKKSQILGKVKYVIPTLGYVISYMQSKKVILILLTVLFLSNLFDILSENNTQKSGKRKSNREE